jgi:hypothetical protein
MLELMLAVPTFTLMAMALLSVHFEFRRGGPI